MEKVNPLALPSVNFSKRDRLPETSGVYFVIRNSEVIYVGRSKNIRARFVTHHRLPDFRNTRISWIDLSFKRTFAVEKDFIESLSPKLNGTLANSESGKILLADEETHHAVKVLAAQRGISIPALLRQDYVSARNGKRGTRERTTRKQRR